MFINFDCSEDPIFDTDGLYKIMVGHKKYSQIISDVYNKLKKYHYDIILNTLNTCHIQQPLLSLSSL